MSNIKPIEAILRMALALNIARVNFSNSLDIYNGKYYNDVSNNY